MKTTKISIILFILLAVGFIVFRMTTGKKHERVRIVQAEYRNIEKTLTISGTIIPEKEIEIKSTISGVLEKLSVRVGEDVQPGTPIASVRYVKDPMEYKNLLNQLEVARTRLDNAELRFKSTQNLYRQKLIAPLEYENEKDELAILRLEYRSVESELKMLRGNYQQKEISNIITATGSGTILELPVKEGGSVMARGTLYEGTTIARLADMNSLVFKGDVLESDILKLCVGMPVKFTLSADKDIQFMGRIEVISPKGTVQDGVSRFQVTTTIDIPENYRKYIKAGRCSVEWGDVSRLTLPAEKFDLVTAFETVYFWPELIPCFNQVARVMKPGGVFLIVHETDGLDPVGRKYEKIIDLMTVYTAEELEEALRAAGFSEIAVSHHETFPWIAVAARK